MMIKNTLEIGFSAACRFPEIEWIKVIYIDAKVGEANITEESENKDQVFYYHLKEDKYSEIEPSDYKKGGAYRLELMDLGDHGSLSYTIYKGHVKIDGSCLMGFKRNTTEEVLGEQPRREG